MVRSSLQTRDISSPVPYQEKALAFKGVGEDQWRIMISFGKSSSANFARALKLAQIAPEYIETEHNGAAIYQATYTAKPKDYLAFVKLYELIKTWKSCNVFINNLIVDRKIIGGLNYCYGDRCRSTDKKFCYGASFMTQNPFGCHRLQISNSNNPWHSFYERQPNGLYKLNRLEMKERIDSFAEKYFLCPAFDYEEIMRVFHGFSDHVSEREAESLESSTSLCVGKVTFPNPFEEEQRGWTPTPTRGTYAGKDSTFALVGGFVLFLFFIWFIFG